MKKVKMQESSGEYPKLNIKPILFLQLYLAGIDEFAFLSEAISTLSQKRSGDSITMKIDEIELVLIKKGSTIELTKLRNANSKKNIVLKLLMNLGRVLSRNKTAIDISTVA